LPSRYRSSVSWQKLHFRWIKAWDSRKVVTPFTRQQLIDEVFCYLKTVKVTAAVYLSLYEKLFTFHFRYQAPGRSQTIYFILQYFALSCVFNKQSPSSILCHFFFTFFKIFWFFNKKFKQKKVSFLPKLQDHFAEFLKPCCSIRFSIL